MEIERKFLLKSLPENLTDYEYVTISQGYLCTEPVVRIRQWNDDYILTYKSKGFRTRIEEEMPLTKESFDHLSTKVDGNVISKRRYLIPLNGTNYTIELDEFLGLFEGIYLAEVEFPDEKSADSFSAPSWFGEEVTYDGNFHNSRMSEMSPSDIPDLVKRGSLQN